MEKSPLISQETATRRVRDALQLRVGRGKRFTFHQIAEASGIPERTIRSYAEGVNLPSADKLLSLCAALGPGFTSDVLVDAGQSANGCPVDEPDYPRALCALTEASAAVAAALADRVVDHQEVAHIAKLMEPLLRVVPSLHRGKSDLSEVGRRA